MDIKGTVGPRYMRGQRTMQKIQKDVGCGNRVTRWLEVYRKKNLSEYICNGRYKDLSK